MEFPIEHLREALSLSRIGHHFDAANIYREILKICPDNEDAIDGLRECELALAEEFSRDIRLAQSLYGEGRFGEAIGRVENLIRLQPASEALHNFAGAVHAGAGHFAEAIDSYDRAIRLNPDYADAWSNRGVALKALRRLGEAVASYDRAIQLRPDFAGSYYNRGNVLQELKQLDQAVDSYDWAIALAPDHAEAYSNRGNALQELKRLGEALASYDKAIALKPHYAEAWFNRGNVLQEQKRLDEAVASYDQAIRLDPNFAEAASRTLLQRAMMCQWDAIDAFDLSALGIATDAVSPFNLLALEDDARHHLLRARNWTRKHHAHAQSMVASSRLHPAPIRIGYFSADFHDHATMHLMAKLFEVHDKSRFELHAFSYGPDRQDGMRRRLIDAVDHFHDVRALSDKDVADLARRKAIDIAVDLKGYTQDSRSGIFSCRAAPIQINYLGYPGSMGADFIDYIIADAVLIPESKRQFYTEKVITLPGSYQINDDARPIARGGVTRGAAGLPERGFVFCCFNNVFKLSPAMFDIWMRLLSRVEGSVLWLLRDNRWAEANLRKEAEARGVDARRLVFADRVPVPDHLARHRCADLFLDTFNCNAHTTASDALWAGLPVVTRLGDGFAARVAGSLLYAVGMPDLVTETTEAYEDLAIDLAMNPDKLAAVKARLAANRLTTSLFDTAQCARHIEHAYELVYDRLSSGAQPDHIDVPLIGKS